MIPGDQSARQRHSECARSAGNKDFHFWFAIVRNESMDSLRCGLVSTQLFTGLFSVLLQFGGTR
jgi:hypothetical protein